MGGIVCGNIVRNTEIISKHIEEVWIAGRE
jgi:hypothetical protein